MKAWVLALVCGLAIAAQAGARAQGGLTISRDGVLTKDGRAYRGIGVNYFDAFYRTLLKPGDRSYEQGFAELQRMKIPFIRFICGGFWPSENHLYREDKKAYFQQLDEFVRSAEKHGIDLIPSLFWTTSTVPDLIGEPCDQWGNTASKTHEFMRTYVREVVSRYAKSPAIWGWEFGNEYDLGADLPNASEHRPPVVPSVGTPSSRSPHDELTHEMIRTAYVAFAREVRKYDKRHIITTGNAFPRPSAWHQMHEKSWTNDTPAQFAEMLAGDNPDPMDVLCVHAYEDYKRITPAMEVSRLVRKPLFVGEFGVPGAPSADTEKRFADMLELIEKERVPLAALWVYDFGNQDDFSVTGTNARSYQLKAIAAANERIRAETASK